MRRNAGEATFKNASGQMMRTCSACGVTKALKMFPPKGNAERSWSCRECMRQYRREEYARKRDDPAYKAKRKRYGKQWYRKYHEAQREWEKERHRRYRERRNADPKRHAVYLENRRIYEHLKKEQEGHVVTRLSGAAVRAVQKEHMLPAKPLYLVAKKYVEGYVADGGTVVEACKTLGTTDREYRRWLNMEQTRVRWETADRLLTNLGLHWWDVWSEEEVPEKIAA